jgi:TRAP-type C4-dicarboxylate transport system permease large subunit
VVFGLKAFVPDVPVWTIYRGTIPFLAMMFVGLAICVHMPAIELFLIPKY